MKSVGFAIIAAVLFCLSCKLAPVSLQKQSAVPASSEKESPEFSRLTITFAGDIMAHYVNFRMKDYSLIYKDIRNILLHDDLTFGNLETPVTSKLPYQTYPAFNIHTEYADAAIENGFDVFSLANNHINDQGTQGIQETSAYFTEKKKNGIYSAGLKSRDTEPITYTVIKKNDWTILFVSITEILNNYNSTVSLINYVSPNKKNRDILAQQLRELKLKIPCDLFIISIHTAESEYITNVSEARRTYFHSLLDCGIDIIWAHHPHVMQEWDIIQYAEEDKKADNEYRGDKLIMYSMGNFISGQRYTINTENPTDPREYTGDSILLQVRLKKESSTAPQMEQAPLITSVLPIYVTNYTDEYRNTLVKQFTREFIAELPETTGAYYSSRLQLMEQYKGNIICK